MKNTIMLNGKRYVCRIFDNGGETFDRFTVCFKAYRSHGRLVYPYLGSSSYPFAAQGFGQHGEADHKIDGKHLGKRIAYDDCPSDVQKLIRQEVAR